MKIGFDAKRAFFNASGLGNYSRFVISGLEKYAPSHEYVYYTPGEGSVAFSPSGEKAFPTGGYQLTTSYWRTYGLSSRLSKDHIQIYHGLSHELPQGVEKTEVKTVVTIHDMIPYRFPQLYKSIDLAIYKKKWEHACKAADVIIAISEQTKKDLIEILHLDASKIEVVYQDCHEQFHIPPTSGDYAHVREKYHLPDDYLLCVATIEERKNQRYILEALEKMPDSMHCVLVGKETNYKSHLESFIRQKGLQERVQFLHDADFKDFPAIYWGAKVFVYPSLYEGFGIPIIEAMNSGVPVITSRGGVFEETGGPAALYVDLKKPEDLVSKVHNLLTDPAGYAQRVKWGEEQVKQFRAEVVIPKLEAIYKQLGSEEHGV